MRLTPKWSLYKLGLPARMIQRLYDVRWRQGLLASCYFIFVANSDMNAIVVFSRTGMTQDGVSHLLLLVETNVKSNFCINMSTFQTATRKLSTLTLAYYPRRINDVYRRLARLAPIPGINNWLPGRTLSNSNEKERATWWPPPPLLQQWQKQSKRLSVRNPDFANASEAFCFSVKQFMNKSCRNSFSFILLIKSLP